MAYVTIPIGWWQAPKSLQLIKIWKKTSPAGFVVFIRDRVTTRFEVIFHELGLTVGWKVN